MSNSEIENDKSPAKEEAVEATAEEVPAAEESSSVTNAVATENDSNIDDEKSISIPDDDEDDEEDEEEGSKAANPVDDASQGSPKASNTEEQTPVTKKERKGIPPSSRRGRAPAVKGLTIPFRTVKKAMKLDPDIPIVQNEAAIMTTLAAELFLKSLAKDSQSIAKSRGRNTIRYEDVAEARTNDSSMAFLKTLLP